MSDSIELVGGIPVCGEGSCCGYNLMMLRKLTTVQFRLEQLL